MSIPEIGNKQTVSRPQLNPIPISFGLGEEQLDPERFKVSSCLNLQLGLMGSLILNMRLYPDEAIAMAQSLLTLAATIQSKQVAVAGHLPDTISFDGLFNGKK